MQLTSIPVDDSYHELTRHGTSEFPMEVYIDKLAEYETGTVPWHWHTELEFAVVLYGDIRYHMCDETFVLHAGEGLFVNSDVLHMVEPVHPSDAVMFSVLAHPTIIGGPHSLLYARYVKPLLKLSGLQFLVLDPAVDWQGEALAELGELYDLYGGGTTAKELGMFTLLCRVWLRLAERYTDAAAPRVRGSHQDEARVKAMMEFVHGHYADPVCLCDIAGAASISVSECCRCFKRAIGMTPLGYLLHIRLGSAARMLCETGDAVTNIVTAVGFNSVSYFGKLFRRAYGLAPLQYRKTHHRDAG